VTRVPCAASRRCAASAISSSSEACSNRSVSRSVNRSVGGATECDTSGSPEPLPPLDELYASEPSEFVATRDRLVKELKAAGDAAGARELAKRKKPTRAAHALNRLARTHARELAAYLDLADALRDAQLGAARDGAARDALRAVDRDRRARLGELLDHVTEDRDEVERALTTALSDPTVAAAVRGGTLEKIPATPSGFDAFAGDLGDALPPPRELAAARKRRDEQRRLDDEIATAQREVKEREAEVRAARAALDEAERHAAAATRALERLQERRERRDG
jgi:hypothetical protein